MKPRKTPLAMHDALRRLSAELYPRLKTMSADEMYDHGRMMAPGGMLLAEMMAERLEVGRGSRVLDLGCGRGQTSIMLARRFGCDVISLDLWVGAEERRKLVSAAGVAELVCCLQGDITRGLPKDIGSLDAIFAMQSFQSFGARPGMLKYLHSLLRQGGQIVIGQTCFSQEPVEWPSIFKNSKDFHVEYGRYHSPAWWAELFARDRFFDVSHCRELPEGDVFWEDHILYCGDRNGWSVKFIEDHSWLFRQVLYGRSRKPRLTHFVLSARKPRTRDTLGGDACNRSEGRTQSPSQFQQTRALDKGRSGLPPIPSSQGP